MSHVFWCALCKTLGDIFPGSQHIRVLGKAAQRDARVWELARQHECLVVSKDEDFHRLALLRGAQPNSCGFGSATDADGLRNYSAPS